MKVTYTPIAFELGDVFEGTIEAERPVGKAHRELVNSLRFIKGPNGEWIKQNIDDGNPEMVEWVFSAAEDLVTKVDLKSGDLHFKNLQDLTGFTEGNELITKLVVKLLEVPKLGKRLKKT